MTGLTGTLSAVVTALGVLAAAIALVSTGSRSTALQVLLDMLVAAGLLRLTGEPSLPQLAGVVVIIALRLLLRTALVQDFRRLRPTDAGRPAEQVGRASGA
ncbi:hypothetical protein SAMN05443287_104373 [Micromonospora phaseoli]|uniref:DUF1622 domain-containing protein n=1 Tax=Micromonospora phaseoli TaxID=1144548 RepID=A0A1H6YQW9_9ACTN|nr:hypothetical protein [Micromonospora phaseoli]PZW00345.1 hypothetical protein CLV64_103372 [Micromonospora phaseoli]GIJ76823.1 hypothetical protein Xph01_12550 [Micromonospora phaseoli]SEJ43693.1 hypothetical protein SAMN05443287_104373 [Micromonospora phaseoli]